MYSLAGKCPLPCPKGRHHERSIQYTFSAAFILFVRVTGGWDQVVWRASTGVIYCAFDQIPNLQNCFTNPNKIYIGSISKIIYRNGGGLYR
jgi:hypothetical protein